MEPTPVEAIGAALEWARWVWVPVISALSGGVMSYLATRYSINAKMAVDLAKQRSDDRAFQATADATQTENMTHRFQALMDGYERRIQDLTTEAHQLRTEVRQLRTELREKDRKIGELGQELRRLSDVINRFTSNKGGVSATTP